MNIWEHLDQFGDLDIKTSQRSKLGKSEKLVIIIKIIKKRYYSGARALSRNLMWSYIYDDKNSGTTIIYLNPKVLLLKRKL